MKKNFLTKVSVVFSACFFIQMICLISTAKSVIPSKIPTIYDTNKLQLPFLENKGQLSDNVKYYTQTQKAVVWGYRLLF
jgi:hypothetical protein